VPSPPTNLFAYIFALYFIIGGGFFVARDLQVKRMMGDRSVTDILEETALPA